ncbi:MAG: flagellar hook-length control protein FliK [Pseudomonadota bacterium]
MTLIHSNNMDTNSNQQRNNPNPVSTEISFNEILSGIKDHDRSSVSQANASKNLGTPTNLESNSNNADGDPKHAVKRINKNTPENRTTLSIQLRADDLLRKPVQDAHAKAAFDVPSNGSNILYSNSDSQDKLRQVVVSTDRIEGLRQPVPVEALPVSEASKQRILSVPDSARLVHSIPGRVDEDLSNFSRDKKNLAISRFQANQSAGRSTFSLDASVLKNNFTGRLTPIADSLPTLPTSQIATKVTSQETHFAPVRRTELSNNLHWHVQTTDITEASREDKGSRKNLFSTVSSQLRSAFDHASENDTRTQQFSNYQQTTLTRSIAPVRVVELSLQPASLGAISVTMRLSGSGLRVSIVATSLETTDLLQEESEKLAALLKSIGYDSDEITVRYAKSIHSR